MKDLNDNDKPREKLYKFGADKLSEYELIAILLGSGSRNEDVLTLSKKLWQYMSKFHRISEIAIDDLMEIEGIGLSKACSIISALELSKRINIRECVDNFSVGSPKSVADIFMNILRDEMKEHFYVLLLDTKNKIISWDEISKGDLNSSIVHPREVFKYALKYSANSIICLHNHPSGDPTPSMQDIEITKRLQEVGNLVGIKLLDHIIIGYNKYISLREKGIMN
ncbi:DNA repair protein RadC [Parvimonas sp. S3374]|uniref:DNA repair protein RadC n=1 Tax=Parvimonas parva TaxID=2769485 RepID=A0ABS1CBG4_9FIRM|nr:DNA repair protein RadC [Parvimonas parva]